MVNRCLTLLTDELLAEGIADPLAESFTLAAIWEDLCRHAGETPPEDVRHRVAGTPAVVHRGALSRADDPSTTAPSKYDP